MISAGSRYAGGTIITATDLDDNDILALTFAAPADTVIRYTTYQVTGADTIDLIANSFYGDPTLWWYVANANPEIMTWDSLTAGQLIRVPLLGA